MLFASLRVFRASLGGWPRALRRHPQALALKRAPWDPWGTPEASWRSLGLPGHVGMLQRFLGYRTNPKDRLPPSFLHGQLLWRVCVQHTSYLAVAF